MLTLQVHEKEIETTTSEEFIRGTVGKTCQIDLDEFWADYSNTIVFKRCDGKPINILIDKLSNTLTIPFDVMAESGVFRIGVFGVAEDKVLPTLWSGEIKVRYGTDTFGTEPAEYTPNEIEQLKATKQDKLTAGDNITIDENNVISATIAVDDELSDKSENPVQNKVVTENLDGKQPLITSASDITLHKLYATSVFANTLSASDGQLYLADTMLQQLSENSLLFSRKTDGSRIGVILRGVVAGTTKDSVVTLDQLNTKQDKLTIESSVEVAGIGATNGVFDSLTTQTLTAEVVNTNDIKVTNNAVEEKAQVDSTEIITTQAGTWVTDGWTGDAITGFTHTSGNTNILKYPITGSEYTAEGTLYDITFNCSIAPTTDNIMVRIGNSDLFNLYGQEEPLNIGVKSKGSTDGTIYLEFIPSSTFTGTISNIKVHKITGTYVGKYTITDSNGQTSFEVRADTVNKYNAYIGVDSGSYNTTGKGNAGFGYKALANNTSGFWNTGIGLEALQFVNAGSRNIGIGAYAGKNIQTGQRNVAIGTHSFRENTTGNFNIAIGADSQLNGKSGDGNIGIGVSSLYYIDGGNENIAIGHGAIAGNNTENKGNYNIALGYFSLISGSNTSNNVAIGYNAGYGINSGNNNVMIGTSAGRNGSSQVVIGANSGLYLQAASSENVILGYYTGNTLRANKNCILIGSRVDGEETGDYQLNIGNLIKGSTQSSNKYVNIDGSLSAKTMSVDTVGTADTAVVNKKYVDDAIGNITALFASLVDMSIPVPTNDEPTDNEEETVNA